MPLGRQGITCAGNWIVDRVKLIDAWPQEERLANVLSETRGGGGGAHNVCIGLARMGAPFPLRAVGVVGDDEDGRWLLTEAFHNTVDITGLHKTKEASTSYTDVMTVKGTGRRTFFHSRGANKLLRPQHLELGPSKILHLAYLLLLDGIDAAAAQVLQRARAAGVKTSIDLVSADRESYKRVVLPALEHVDYLFLNDFEAGECAERELRKKDGTLDRDAVREAAVALRRDNLVIIHMPEGAFAASREGEVWVPAKPVEKVVSTVGAGDAFAAGTLYGLHEGWPVQQAMDLGHLAAAACLGHETTTGGLRPVAEL
ncbi:MAG TPA: carbohydrate kinase family protein [Planctomycetota bacterium]